MINKDSHEETGSQVEMPGDLFFVPGASNAAIPITFMNSCVIANNPHRLRLPLFRATVFYTLPQLPPGSREIILIHVPIYPDPAIDG